MKVAQKAQAFCITFMQLSEKPKNMSCFIWSLNTGLTVTGHHVLFLGVFDNDKELAYFLFGIITNWRKIQFRKMHIIQMFNTIKTQL